MRRVPIKLGPLALLLTVISICLTTMAILHFVTARADSRLTEKYAETVESRYRLEAEGQSFLRDLDRALHSGNSAFLDELQGDEQNVLVKRLELDDTSLEIRVRLAGETWQVEEWRIVKDWSEDMSMGDLWPGQ
jgi:KaiC/GvpD/RAD55 family RecA-like ATPase